MTDDLQRKKQEVLTAWQEYENAVALAASNRRRVRTARTGIFQAVSSSDNQKLPLYLDEAASARLQEQLAADESSQGERFDHLSRELLKVWWA